MFISISMTSKDRAASTKSGTEAMFSSFKYRTKITGVSNSDALIQKLKSAGIIKNAETVSKAYTKFVTKYGTIFYITRDNDIYLCSDKDGQASALQAALKTRAHLSPKLTKVMDAIMESFKAMAIPVKREGHDLVATIDSEKYALALTPLH